MGIAPPPQELQCKSLLRMLTDAIHSFPVHRIRLKATHLPGPATVWQDGPTDDTTQNHATQLLPAQRH